MKRSMTGAAIVLAIAAGAAADPSPLATVERLHDALREANPAKADAVLHEQYHGVSLQGPLTNRHVFVETRSIAIDTLATLQPGSWDVRILSAAEHVDANGMAEVWARYAFYLDGVPHHCGHESYVLFNTASGWKIVSFNDTDTLLEGRPPEVVCPP